MIVNDCVSYSDDVKDEDYDKYMGPIGPVGHTGPVGPPGPSVGLGKSTVSSTGSMMFGNYGYGMGNISITTSDDQDKLKAEDINKLSPKPGDLLVFHIKDCVDGLYDKLRRTLDGWGFNDIQFVVMADGNDVSCLNEGEMEKLGWIRKREKRGFEFL